MQLSGNLEDNHGHSVRAGLTADCISQQMLERLSIKFTMDFRKENSDVWPLPLLLPIQKSYILLSNQNKTKTKDYIVVTMLGRIGSSLITTLELLYAHFISHE